MMYLINARLAAEYSCRARFKSGLVLDLIYEDSSTLSRIRKFTGICIATRKSGFGFRYVLRNVVDNIAVELAIDETSSTIISLTKANLYKKLPIHRAKFYYLRRKRLVDSKV